MPKQWLGIFFLTITLQVIFTSAAAATESPSHITTAQILNIAGHGYSAPPQAVNEALLPNDWVAVEL
ncbi:MAG: hypothetical protein K2X80_02470, partial [Pseudomonadaceae bacterium]|nr:hypothetical protein [Pseudomonadaceae bacterium]